MFDGGGHFFCVAFFCAYSFRVVFIVLIYPVISFVDFGDDLQFIKPIRAKS